MKRLLLSFVAILSCVMLFAQGLECPMYRIGSGEQILHKTGFTVSYNAATGCPDWVAWCLTEEHLNNSVTSRGDSFYEDAEARRNPVHPSDYSRNGRNLDRGHMCPSADQTWSQKANDDSFLMTNICPQNHTLNEGLWLELEQRCRVYAKMYGEVYVCCGPVWDGEQPPLAGGKVRVPGAFFKVMAVRDRSGAWHCIGFVFENAPLDKKDNIFDYEVSVSDIERLTGLHLFPKMKNRAEDGRDSLLWNIRWRKH